MKLGRKIAGWDMEWVGGEKWGINIIFHCIHIWNTDE